MVFSNFLYMQPFLHFKTGSTIWHVENSFTWDETVFKRHWLASYYHGGAHLIYVTLAGKRNAFHCSGSLQAAVADCLSNFPSQWLIICLCFCDCLFFCLPDWQKPDLLTAASPTCCAGILTDSKPKGLNTCMTGWELNTVIQRFFN